MKKYKLISVTLLLLICVTYVSAGTTTLNQDMNLSVGDCWNNKQITQVDGLKITWDKGCSQETKPGDVSKEENGISSENKGSAPTNEAESPNSIPLEDGKAQDKTLDTHFCNLIEGNGDHAIIVYGNNIYDDNYMLDWANWVYNDIQTRTPYNEFTYSLYYEKNQGDCGFNSYSNIEMGIIELGTYYGMSWFNGYDTSKVWFDDNLDERGNSEKWDFLLFHEFGHVFTLADHTQDGSIMDKNGGNGKYNEQEINTIRENLQ